MKNSSHEPCGMAVRHVRLGALHPFLGGCRAYYGAITDVPHARQRLVHTLCRHIRSSEHRNMPMKSMGEYVLRKDPLGRPYLVQGASPGPALSFSSAGKRRWACATARCRVGIDVSLAGEFEPSYPFARAFHSREIALAREAGDTARGDAAALVWSAKEAVVKAHGVGFNFLDPLHLEIGEVLRAPDWLVLTLRSGPKAGVLARRIRGGWLSIAWVPCRHHETMKPTHSLSNIDTLHKAHFQKEVAHGRC